MLVAKVLIWGLNVCLKSFSAYHIDVRIIGESKGMDW